MIKTIEGNTSSTKGLVANGGCVAEKSYANTYSKIAVIFRPKYKSNEAHNIVAEAKKWVNYTEKKSNSLLSSFTANSGSNNYTIFAEHAKKVTGLGIYENGKPWCDTFVDDIFIRVCGVARAKELLGDFSAYTPTSAANLGKVGADKVITDCVRYGDIIFFKNSTRICHTGIVINGYTSVPAVSEDKFEYSFQEFTEDILKATGKKTLAKAFNKTKTLSEKKNSKDILVLIVQKRLKNLGYYIGVPDREFGPMTTSAVNRYQKEVLKYRTCDGEITKKGNMWRSLLGLK